MPEDRLDHTGEGERPVRPHDTEVEGAPVPVPCVPRDTVSAVAPPPTSLLALLLEVVEVEEKSVVLLTESPTPDEPVGHVSGVVVGPPGATEVPVDPGDVPTVAETPGDPLFEAEGLGPLNPVYRQETVATDGGGLDT